MSIEQVDFVKVHRAGWSYVIQYLSVLHDSKAPLMVDCYLDKTFGWLREQYTAMGILPYKKAWIGLFHHTNARSYLKNNIIENMSTKEFRLSLSSCKGFITLTDHLKKQIQAYFLERSWICPPILVLYHPSEEPLVFFSWEKFINNPSKKVIQIGSWYRQSFAIYKLPLEKDYKNPLKFSKAALKGKLMKNYFRPASINIQMTKDMETGLKKINMVSCHCGCKCESNKNCKCNIESFENKYVHGLLKAIEDMDTSVMVLEHLSNEEYDNLLTEKLSFSI